MRRAIPIIAVLAAVGAVALGYLSAGGPRSGPSGAPDQNVLVPKLQAGNNDVHLGAGTVRIGPGADRPARALEALFAQAQTSPQVSPVPKGVRLQELRLENGVARIDLSAEFRGVNEMGNTGESNAQNALRKSLSQYPSVKFMTISVDGKLFEGQHSGEWSEVPVRDEPVDGGATR